MADLQAAIISNRQAVRAFLDAARAVPPGKWTTPRVPGKWSPGQVTEHVLLTYEQSRLMLLGTFSGTAQPWFRQLLARRLFLPLLLKRGNFGKGPIKGPDFIQPSGSPASSTELQARVEAAADKLESDLAAASDAGRKTLDHPIFGRLPFADLLRFLVIHTQHHRLRLSAGAL